jgi:hypothetical protein
VCDFSKTRCAFGRRSLVAKGPKTHKTKPRKKIEEEEGTRGGGGLMGPHGLFCGTLFPCFFTPHAAHHHTPRVATGRPAPARNSNSTQCTRTKDLVSIDYSL